MLDLARDMWKMPEPPPPDPNDPVEVLIAKAREKFKKVEHFPEDSPTGMIDLISLRNLVPELIRHLKVLNDERKKSPAASPPSGEEGPTAGHINRGE